MSIEWMIQVYLIDIFFKQIGTASPLLHNLLQFGSFLSSSSQTCSELRRLPQGQVVFVYSLMSDLPQNDPKENFQVVDGGCILDIPTIIYYICIL